MRNAFIEELARLAEQDDRIFLVTADLGFTVVEHFANRYPDRYLNVGVAEQNMMGIATGLAQTGYVPFCYSIATFTSMRAYEQIRNGPVLHGLPVRLVGIGGGYAYGHAGPTHHALEDLCIFRPQPGMTVVAPADPEQTRSVVRAIQGIPGPVYLRVGKGRNPPVPGLDGRFAFDTPELVKQGEGVLFVAIGDAVHGALEAAERLGEDGTNAAVAVMAHLARSPSTELVELLRPFRAVVSVEVGFSAGGLGSLVAEAIACNGLQCRLAVKAVHASFDGYSGSAANMRSRVGLDPAAIADAARVLLSGDPA